MEQPQVSQALAVLLAFLFAIIVCFGGIANGVVVLTHIKYRKKLLMDSKDVLIFSLAIGDFVMCAVLTPMAFSSAIAKKWTTGENGCIIYGFITTWIGLSSILQLTCIAVERHYTLSCLNADTGGWRKRTIRMITGSWLFAFLASSLPLFGFSKFTLEGFGLHCSIVWNDTHAWYCLFLLFFFYVIPINTIVISYNMMFRVVRKVYRNAAITWGANSQVTRQSYTAQVKFTKQIFIVTCGFFIAWTPYAVMSSLRVLTNIEFGNGWYELPALFAKTGSMYNPIIYFFMYRRLRRHISMFLNEARSILSLSSIVHWFPFTRLGDKSKKFAMTNICSNFQKPCI